MSLQLNSNPCLGKSVALSLNYAVEREAVCIKSIITFNLRQQLPRHSLCIFMQKLHSRLVNSAFVNNAWQFKFVRSNANVCSYQKYS